MTNRGLPLADLDEVERDLPWVSSEEMNRRRAQVWAYEFLDDVPKLEGVRGVISNLFQMVTLR